MSLQRLVGICFGLTVGLFAVFGAEPIMAAAPISLRASAAAQLSVAMKATEVYAPVQGRVHFTPTVLDTAKLNQIDTATTVFSPDGRRVAYTLHLPDGDAMVVDGTVGPSYAMVGLPSFSNDGQRFAYAAIDQSAPKNRMVVVEDGVVVNRHEDILENGFVFSPDGTRLAYVAIQGDKQFVVSDGMPGPDYDWVNGLVFSSDSRQFGYIAGTGDEVFVVFDGQSSSAYADAAYVAFTPDQRSVYAFLDEEGWHIMVDGIASKAYLDIYDITFSPNAERMAFIIPAPRNTWQIIVDGVTGKRYSNVGELTFSPDSSRFAYLATQNDGVFAVVDGVEQPVYEDIGLYSLSFSADSQQFAYGAYEDDQWFAVVDGQEGPRFDDIGWLTFSPDGRRMAYSVEIEGEWQLALDHQVSADSPKHLIIHDVVPTAGASGYRYNALTVVGGTVQFENVAVTWEEDPIQPATIPFVPTLPAGAQVVTDTVIRKGPNAFFPVAGAVAAGAPITVARASSDGSWYQLGDGHWIVATAVAFDAGAPGHEAATELPGTSQPTPTPAEEPAAASEGAPVSVLLPRTGRELTLGDGTKIRHPFDADDVPHSTNNELATMAVEYSISVVSDGGSMRHLFEIEFKQAGVITLRIDEVSLEPITILISTTTPISYPSWSGSATQPFDAETTPWLYTDGDTILIYRVTAFFEDGTQVIFYQPANIPAVGKSSIRKILAGIVLTS